MTTHLSRRAVSALLAVLLLSGAGGIGVAAQDQPSLPPPPALTGETGWEENAVCYEVFVRSFADGDGDGVGDLPGLIGRLDYVNDGDPTTATDLGATCLWLMPIFASPSYHGYDTVDYYNVDAEYGTNEDFKRLVAEAHARGIRVILDLMLNHTSSEHPSFQEALRDPASPYRDWYIWADEDPNYRGPWGDEAWHRSPVRDEYYYGVFWEGMPDLNYRNPAVTAEARAISAYWLGEMGADGFRLDAIKHLIEDGRIQENTPETQRWLREYRTFLDGIAPEALTVGEVFGASPSVLASYYPDQLDSYFQFEVGSAILAAANYGLAADVATTVEDAMGSAPDQRWAPFLTNHDQPRVMTQLGGDVTEAKVAATALLTLPGLPFLYYGEEIGMAGDKPDELIRTPMQWNSEPGGGFTAGSPWAPFQPDHRQVNVAAQTGDPDSLLSHYRRLVHLHTTHPALGHGGFVALETSTPTVVAYLRQAAGESILVVINFGKQPVDGALLSGAATGLAGGRYQATPLLPGETAAPLAVGGGGAIDGYAPLATLAPQTGYVFSLTRQ